MPSRKHESVEVGEKPASTGISRRQLLVGAGATIAGAAVAVTADQLLVKGVLKDEVSKETDKTYSSSQELGAATISPYGVNQPGITVASQSHSSYLALDLKPGSDKTDIRRLLRLLTDDIVRLTTGKPVLADTEPELAFLPASLTVTVGFGAHLIEVVAGKSAVPRWLKPLPLFRIDALEDYWSGGDLLLHVAANDPMTVSHAVRMLLKDARSFANLKWQQQGFLRAAGSEQPGTTPRNLFGQVDGTENPKVGTSDFDDLVWVKDGWLAGGSSLVIRRIEMDLEGWDQVDRPARETAVGRNLKNGAPLTGVDEFDEPDFQANNAIGFPIIPDFAHIRRARGETPKQRFFRRAYNYDLAATPPAISNSGLIFTSYQADVEVQFVPIQQRLADLDLLNEWTTPIGSAVFALPAGLKEGEIIGGKLFE